MMMMMMIVIGSSQFFMVSSRPRIKLSKPVQLNKGQFKQMKIILKTAAHISNMVLDFLIHFDSTRGRVSGSW